MTGHSKLAAAGIVAAVFLSGGIAGGAVMRLLDRPETAEAVTPSDSDGRPEWTRGQGDRDGPRRSSRRPPNPRSFLDERAFDRLVEHLELTDDQRDEYRGILERQRDEASAVFSEFGPRLQALMDSTNAQFRRLLTDEQQVEFDNLIGQDRNALGRRYRGGGDERDDGEDRGGRDR